MKLRVCVFQFVSVSKTNDLCCWKAYCVMLGFDLRRLLGTLDVDNAVVLQKS